MGIRRHRRAVLAFGLCVVAPVAAISGQARIIRIVDASGSPVPFANVWVNGGEPRIASDSGMVHIGALPARGATIDVRRIGYTLWTGTLGNADTNTVITVTMQRNAATLGVVTVKANRAPLTIALAGFYDRALLRQKGLGSGTYFSPEEIERRNPGRVTDLLRQVGTVRLEQGPQGQLVALGRGGTCQLAVLIDGIRVRTLESGTTSAGNSMGSGGRTPSDRTKDDNQGRGGLRYRFTEKNAVFIDQLVSPGSVAAVEVYPRGSALPPALEQNSDAACGLVAVWTGARR